MEKARENFHHPDATTPKRVNSYRTRRINLLSQCHSAGLIYSDPVSCGRLFSHFFNERLIDTFFRPMAAIVSVFANRTDSL